MISFKGRSKYKKYEPSKPTKFGFKPYVLSDYRLGYTYGMKLIEDIKEFENEDDYSDEDIDNSIHEKNKNNINHILAIDGLYTCEELLDMKKFYFIGSIRKNKIKSNNNEIVKDIKEYKYKQYSREGKNHKVILTVSKIKNNFIL